MRVILLKDVRGTGSHGEVKEVADGYARNHLIPRGLAEVATQEKIAKLERERAAREAARHKEDEALAAALNSLRGKKVLLSVRATEKGGLFKTVTAGDIAKAAGEQHGVSLPALAVQAEPIKTTGLHRVALKHKNASSELEVEVAAA